MSQDLLNINNPDPFVGSGELIFAGCFTGLEYTYPKTLPAGCYLVQSFPGIRYSPLDNNKSQILGNAISVTYGFSSHLFLKIDETRLTFYPSWKLLSSGNAYPITTGTGGPTTNTIYDGTNIMWFGHNFTLGTSALRLSTDGITWTTRSVGSNAIPNTIASGQISFVYNASVTNKYIIGFSTTSTTNNIAYSTDGVTWSLTGYTVTSQAGAVSFAINPNVTQKYVAIDRSSSNISNIISSTDGVTWTSRNSGFAQFKRCLATNGGNSGEVYVYTQDNTNQIGTSTDGITWTTRTTGGINNGCAIAYFDNKWVLTYITANSVIATSTDAITWTHTTMDDQLTTSSTAQFTLSANSRLFINTPTSDALVFSTNGTTWKSFIIGFSSGSQNTHGLHYINNKYIAFLGSTLQIFFEPDAQYVAVYRIDKEVGVV